MNKLKTMVTGEPRSGTSLMMNILKELDIDIAGEKFPNIKDENQSQRINNLNPLGFYEVPGIVTRGVRNVPDKYNNTAVKIISSGAYPRIIKTQIMGTPPENYEKAILCIRNPRAISVSQQGLELNVETSEDKKWTTPKLALNPGTFLQRTGAFLIWLSEQSQEIRNKFIIIDYDKLINDPETEIKKVAKHLNIEYKDTNVVDKTLNRSKLESWPSEIKEIGYLSDIFYNAILQRDFDKLQICKIELDEYTFTRQLETTRWIDTEFKTYRMITPTLYRGLKKNNDNVLKTLLIQQKFHDYTKSKYYSESEEEYTINRPADIGNLTRKLVYCKHPDYEGIMSHEEFRELWKLNGRKKWL